MRTTLLLLLLAACASAPSKPTGDAPAGPDAVLAASARAASGAAPSPVVDQVIVCAMERPTGSHIPERVCRLVDRRPDSKLQLQEDLRKNANVQRGGQ